VVDPSQFDCSVNRTNGDTTTQMSLINHFLDMLVLGQPAPDIEKANITNAATGAGSLGAHVDTCITLNTRPPNFMLVDVSLSHSLYSVCTNVHVQFYEYGGGSVFQVAATINGVTYSPTTPVATPSSTSSSTASGTSSSGSNNSASSTSNGKYLAAFLVFVATLSGGYTIV
jgi:hypothetical protein